MSGWRIAAAGPDQVSTLAATVDAQLAHVPEK
jgi:hypothetical protein